MDILRDWTKTEAGRRAISRLFEVFQHPLEPEVLALALADFKAKIGQGKLIEGIEHLWISKSMVLLTSGSIRSRESSCGNESRGGSYRDVAEVRDVFMYFRVCFSLAYTDTLGSQLAYGNKSSMVYGT